jgi:4-carboxymuconolactone decarboxylase
MAVDGTRLEEIPNDALSSAQALVVRKLMSERGRVPTPFKIWLHSPLLADHLHDLGSFLANGTSLSPREAKIAILLMAAHWHAEYVFKMQAREAREAGLPEAVIEAIAGEGEQTSGLHLADPRERAVYQVVHAFTRAAPISDAVFADAVNQLGHPGVAEMLAFCGYFTSVALATRLYRVS